MLKEHIINSVKITAGVIVAVLLTKALKMEFYNSVATIVIVSMLSAKRQSIKLAGTRVMSSILCKLFMPILQIRL